MGRFLHSSYFMVVTVLVSLTISGCGGGDGDGSDGANLCSTLKIAGGEECSSSPGAIALVATDVGYCSGTFITPRHVLTAAHCFPRPGQRVLVVARNFQADASRVSIHPRYNRRVISDEFDVAVVTLPVGAPVTPVPLLLSREVARGSSVITYGYGLDEEGLDVVERVESGDAALKATSLEVVSVSDFSVVTRSDGTGDTCRGDSGGALLANGSNGAPGIAALVRAGPATCEADTGFASDNTNIQNDAVLNFILSVAPSAQAN